MSFNSIQGHSKEIGILAGAVSSRRVAHSYLFAGPDGVGKRLVALALAKALNCEESPAPGVRGEGGEGGRGGLDACGECASCRRIGDGFHLNLVVVEPEKGAITIARIRELQGTLKYRVERGRRVAIVDGADKLNKAASNAFLKTLEEPPEGVVIVLITSRPAELLPTIVSRCQRINFKPLAIDIVKGELRKRFAGELSEEDLEYIARYSTGSLSTALGEAASGDYRERREFGERFERVLSGPLDVRLKEAWDLSKEEDLEGILEFMKLWYRDRVVNVVGTGVAGVAGGGVGAGGTVSGARVGNEQAGEQAGVRGLLRSFELVEEARRSITPPSNANKRLVMEVLLMRLAECAAGAACAAGARALDPGS